MFTGAIVYGADLDRLEALVVQQLGVRSAILCESGSFALEICLRACGVRAGDEVIIPTFCCTAVVRPILALGAIPVLADVGEELNLTAETVAAALTEKTKTIVVPHLFGNPADIESIVDLARGRNIRVVDDAAQALGATIDGHAVGTFGDAGILSFGNEKVCAGLGGGVGVSNDKTMFRDIDLRLPGFYSVASNALSTVLWRRWRRWTFPAEALFHRNQACPDTPPLPYREQGMANLNAAVACSLIQTLSENIAARRARVRAYRELLGKVERLQLISHRRGSACLTQVVRVSPRRNEDAAAHVIEDLGEAGYEVQGSYVPIHLLSPYEGFVRMPLPHAERVWADLIELPCEPEVSLDHLERIATIAKQSLNS